jgi:endonuclease/exonuclease/phosphatase family metal-dependent hydrolase
MQLSVNRGRFVVARGGILGVLLAIVLAVPHTAAAQSEAVMNAASASKRVGKWRVERDSSALGGKVIRHPNQGARKVKSALASPANYFELTFKADAGKPYRLWIRGKADSNHWSNDSVFVQFNQSVTSRGAAAYRIGTTSAAEVNLEACADCGISGWEWQDNGYGKGILGPQIYFSKSGTQKLRVQTREDGLAIDRVVLSAVAHLTESPDGSGGSSDVATPAGGTATEIALQASGARVRVGKWTVQKDGSAIGGAKIRHPDGGRAKIETPKASPRDYFELSFNAVAGKPYRLWIRGRADGDEWSNDSVFVQFSGSVNKSGKSVYRIGTTSGTAVNLEPCKDCGFRGWIWQDNGWGWGALGPEIYFAKSGTQTMRVQTREDGLSIDQIRLSPSKYRTSKPSQSGGSVATPAPQPSKPKPAPAPDPEPEEKPSGSGKQLKVLVWNTHHGVGQDGKYNLERFGTWIGKWRPDVVMIIEAEKFTGWGNENQPERYKSIIQRQTGQKWYYVFAQEYGNWNSNGKGNLLLSRYPFTSTGRDALSYERTIATGVINVNGRNITLMATHFDPESRARRLTQAKQVAAEARNWPGPQIVGGDLNAWPDQTSIAEMNRSFYDSWAVAEKAGKASSFAGNSPFGATKNGRIDYIFYSKEDSSVLRVIRSQVPDTRNANRRMPSDHRPVLTTFEVR